MSRVVETLRSGLAFHQAGRRDEAEAAYAEALRKEPGNVDALHLLGRVAFERGDCMGAAARVVQAIERQPRVAAFHTTLGEILASQGRHREAAWCYEEALRLDPGHIAALVNLGNALQSLGRYQDASVVYVKAIQQRPDCVEAYSNLGNALRWQGQHEEAVECYRQALRLSPESAEVAVNLSAACLCRQQYAESETWARSALAWRPGLVEALSNLSLALLNQQSFGEAEQVAREAIGRAPEAAHLHSNLGSVLLHQKRLQEAEAAYRRALELQPGYPEAANNLSMVLRSQDRLEESAGLLEEVVRQRPGFAEAWTNLGTVRQAQGQHAEALGCFDQALRSAPHHAKTHFCRGLSLLSVGRFAEGFPEYEWRWELLGAHRSAQGPAWMGEALEGKTVLLYAEQGLGDTIHFVRFAPVLANLGARVVVECQAGAAPLVRPMEGVARVIGAGDSLPEFDFQCPLMSVPGRLGVLPETIPRAARYLRADRESVDALRARLGPAAALRVGLAWAGNPQHASDHLRSVTLEKLAPLAGLTDIDWYSLHVNEAAREEVHRAGGWVREILTDTGGLPELAGLMSSLDLVITVDTMACHLAGALGVPAWNLLSWAPDWRWQLEVERTPWYPSMRLFRQPAPGEWNALVRKVEYELRCAAIQDLRNRSDMEK